MSDFDLKRDDTENCFCSASGEDGLGILPQRLQEIIDKMPIICNTFDRNLNIIDCNFKALEVFEMSSKEELIKNFSALLPEFQPDGSPSAEKLKSHVKLAFETGSHSFDWVDQKLNGDPVPSYVSLVVFSWKNEQYVVCFAQDMRQYHKARNADRFAKEKIQHVFESLPMPCFVIDEYMQISEVNREVMELFGIDDEKLTFESLVSDYSPKYQADGMLSKEKAHERFNLAIKSKRTSFEWMHQTSSKELIPCNLELAQFEQDGKSFLIAYIEDMRTVNKAAHLEQEVNKLEHLAYIDALTGAYNRAFFMENAEEAFQQCVVDDLPFSLIFLDADHFKNINDTYGHAVGDEVLKIIVARMRNVLKKDTLTARFGGEEFVVLLPNVNVESAKAIAGRIKNVINSPPFGVGKLSIPVTASLGIGIRCETATTLSEVINNADKALYEAKNAGRNTIAVYCEN